jgi:hypothetical protein
LLVRVAIGIFMIQINLGIAEMTYSSSMPADETSRISEETPMPRPAPTNPLDPLGLDPLGMAPAMMTWWRMAMFDMPLAFAAEMNASSERWMEHQAAFFARLGQSKTLEDVTHAQTDLVDRSIADYRKSSDAISRDLKLIVDAA